MSYCKQHAITDAAFGHLAGVHTLDMSGCNQATVTDAAFDRLLGPAAALAGGGAPAQPEGAAAARSPRSAAGGAASCPAATTPPPGGPTAAGGPAPTRRPSGRVHALDVSACCQETITDACRARLRAAGIPVLRGADGGLGFWLQVRGWKVAQPAAAAELPAAS
jgi:hypothetical protein